MAALSVGRLTAPLDASVLKPDFDLSLDETQLSGQVAPADHTRRLEEASTHQSAKPTLALFFVPRDRNF